MFVDKGPEPFPQRARLTGDCIELARTRLMD